MTEGEKIEEWVRFVGAAVEGYIPWALVAVYEADGEKMLAGVLRRLSLEQTSTLIRRLSERGRTVAASQVDSAGRIREGLQPAKPASEETDRDDSPPWE